MKQNMEEILETLIGQIKNPKDLELIQDQILKRGIQALLKGELESHLGYAQGAKPVSDNIRNGYSEKTIATSQGEITIEVPRDRNGTFDPVTVPKHKTMVGKLEQTMLSLYAKGMSTNDIVEFMSDTYGVKYSPMQVSIITNRLLEDIKEWQVRPLEADWAVLWIDAIHYKIRHEGRVVTKAAMLVLGVDLSGMQDLLGIYIVEQESAASWANIMTDLRNRGLKNSIFICSDNLSGLQNAVQAVLPKSVHQICIVHQIRNTLKFVSYKDRKSLMSDVKAIYQADNQEAAKIAFNTFKANWSLKYSSAVDSWEANWDALTAFLQYPPEVKKLIYTTNIIESFNASLRKYTNNKKVFPNDDSALKSIYLALLQIKSKWSLQKFNWPIIYNQLYLYFPMAFNTTEV